MAGFVHILVALAWVLSRVSAEVVPFLEPGFFFDYDRPTDVPVRHPVTEQCETIHMKWSRQAATGPNPVAPYFFQIFTSSSIVPFVISAGSGLTFDYAVPFAPGTLYQICMYDSLGTPGGCQDLYTMIPNSTVSKPSCSNVTTPEKIFKPTGNTTFGPLSQFGVVNQCSDISITPTNGKPPFTLTISPPLHPAYNLTSNTSPIVWTASLSRAMHFFVSLTSSDGFVWSNGPMLIGQSDDYSCLAGPGTMTSSKAHATAVGAGLGGLFGGIFLVGAAWFLRYCVNRNRKQKSKWDEDSEMPSVPEQKSSPPATVNPFAHSDDITIESTSARRLSRVYLVHQDAGLEVVPSSSSRTAEFVELPPTYVDRDDREVSRPVPEKPILQEED